MSLRAYRVANEKKNSPNNALLCPNQLAGILALSNGRLVGWGIRLPIQDNIRTMGKPECLKEELLEVKDEILLPFVDSQRRFRVEF